MAHSPSIGPLLPQHYAHKDVVPPPPYSPSDPAFYPTSGSRPKTSRSEHQLVKSNRRKSYLCMGIAVLFLVIVPLTIFGGIVVKIHSENCGDQGSANCNR